MGRWPDKPIDKPTKFEYIYKDDDGVESIWKYDLRNFQTDLLRLLISFQQVMISK